MISNEESRSSMFGSCFGIPIYVHWSFFLLLGFSLLFSIVYTDALYSLFLFLLYGPILLLTIIIHELGHGIVTKKLGGEVEKIILWPLGGFALCGPTDHGASGDLKVAVAGPLTHLPMMGIWAALHYAANTSYADFSSRTIYIDDLNSSASGFFTALTKESFYMNLFLFIFNLLIPAYPLDGGRVLAALLIIGKFEKRKAAKITAFSGMFIAGLIAVWGVWQFIVGNAGGIFDLIIAGFVFFSAQNLYYLSASDLLQNHPIFGRECYNQERSTSSTNNSEQEMATAEVPVENTDAEII